MGIPVMILGPSGSGKSSSLRNFDPSKIAIYNVAGKPLPFKKAKEFKNIIKTANYESIKTSLRKNNFKTYVIDDSQYLMAFEAFDKAKETGYTKFTNIAVNFKQIIDCVIKETSDDTLVFFLHHTELDENGVLKAKTIGKMLDTQLTVEGLFSIVLMASVQGSEHFFITQSDGSTTCKSPMEMFEIKIDNDLAFVDKTIREYYGFN